MPGPSPEDLPGLGLKSASLKSPALAGRFFTTSATWEGRQPKFNILKTRLITSPSSPVLPNVLPNYIASAVSLIVSPKRYVEILTPGVTKEGHA